MKLSLWEERFHLKLKSLLKLLGNAFRKLLKQVSFIYFSDLLKLKNDENRDVSLGYLVIEIVKPGTKYRDVGNVIQKHAQAHGFSVVRSYCGHGIHRLFHTAPSIPHYAST